MQFKNYKEFFEAAPKMMVGSNSLKYEPWELSEEERYRHFKARLMEEVVAEGETLGFLELPFTTTFSLKDKEG